MSTILWFRRDLRIEDNSALALAAAGDGPVLPLYIVEPELWGQPDRSARQWRFVAECLESLRADLARLGAPLLVRVGPAEGVLDSLHADHGVTRLVSHQEIGSLWSRERDRNVAAWAGERGVTWCALSQPGQGTVRSDGRGLPARWAREMRGAMPDLPAGLRPHGLDPGDIPDAADLHLGFDPCPGRQRGGRGPMQQAFGGTGGRACLSPYLSHGAVSARQICQLLPTADREARAGLVLREKARKMMHDQQDIDVRAVDDGAEAEWGCIPDGARLAAWCAGQTGLPFIDACMRRLTQTGHLPHEMRALLVSVARHHLRLDWRATGMHLARLFTDYDPGIHWPQIQMHSGCAGMRVPCIANPVIRGRELDPQGKMIRAWLPEMRPVPDEDVHSPWTWGRAGRFLGRVYPVPVIDPHRATRIARRRIAPPRPMSRIARQLSFPV